MVLTAAATKMFVLIVAIVMQGQVLTTVKYNKATWPTEAACVEFMKSDAGQKSLAGLLDAVHEQISPEADISPACIEEVPAE